MGWNFQDTDGNWKPVAADDPIWNSGATGTATGASDWNWNGKSLAGQSYQQTADEGGGGDLAIPDLAGPKSSSSSSSYSGPPSWSDAGSQELWNQYKDTFLASLDKAIKNVEGGGSYGGDTRAAYDRYTTEFAPTVEQLRQDIPKQFLAGMDPFEKTYQPVLDAMSKRGIVNSDVSGEALGQVTQDLQRLYGQQVANANVFAGQQTLADLAQRPALANTLNNSDIQRLVSQGSLAGTGQTALANLVNLGRTSTSQSQSTSTDDSTMWRALLPYILGNG